VLRSSKLKTFCYNALCQCEISKEWKTSLRHLNIKKNDSFGSQIFPYVKSISISSSNSDNFVSLETIFPSATQIYLIYDGPSNNWTNVPEIINEIQMHCSNIKIACLKTQCSLIEFFFGSVWTAKDRENFCDKGISKPKAAVLLKKDINGLMQWSTFDTWSSEFTQLSWHHLNLDEFFYNVSNV